MIDDGDISRMKYYEKDRLGFIQDHSWLGREAKLAA